MSDKLVGGCTANWTGEHLASCDRCLPREGEAPIGVGQVMSAYCLRKADEIISEVKAVELYVTWTQNMRQVVQRYGIEVHRHIPFRDWDPELDFFDSEEEESSGEDLEYLSETRFGAVMRDAASWVKLAQNLDRRWLKPRHYALLMEFEEPINIEPSLYWRRRAHPYVAPRETCPRCGVEVVEINLEDAVIGSGTKWYSGGSENYGEYSAYDYYVTGKY